MFTKEQVAALSAKLDAGHVKQRSQAGRNLSYIEGWHAIAEANRIFGFDSWERETVDMKQCHEPIQNDKGNWVVGYWAKVRVTVWTHPDKNGVTIRRDGCGFGSGIDRDLGRAHESALKEAETDAMKRALMTFGNPFGLALYDKTQENVERDTGNGHGNGHPKSPPPPPKPPNNSVTDWNLIADDMISDAKKLRDVGAINAMLKDRRDQYDKMPAQIQQRVQAAVKAHRESLAALMP